MQEPATGFNLIGSHQEVQKTHPNINAKSKSLQICLCRQTMMQYKAVQYNITYIKGSHLRTHTHGIDQKLPLVSPNRA